MDRKQYRSVARNLLCATLVVSIAIGLLVLPNPASAAELDDLLKNVQDENSEVRVEAARTAAEAGTDALVPLARLIDLENQFVVKDVKHAMRNIVNHAGRPGAAQEREAAAKALASLLVEGNSTAIRREAVYLLGFAGSGAQVASVKPQLLDPVVREDAVACLERIPGKEATQALLEALNEVPNDFKSRVLAVIGRRGDKNVVPVLVKFSKKAPSDLRIDVLEALVKIGELPKRIPPMPMGALLSERENSRLPDILLRVADLYLEKGDKKRAAEFYQGVLDGAVGDHIACGALIGLGKVGDPSLLPFIGEKLSDESPSIRSVASKIVTEWPGSDVDALLAKRLQDAGGDEQAALLKVLVQRDAKGVDELLVKSLSSDNPGVRITSVQILGERGGKDLEGAFLEAAVDADLGVAKAAKMSYLILADRVLADGDADHALEMYHKALSFTSDADAIRKALSGVAGLGKAESVEKVRALLEQPPVAIEAARAYLQLAKAFGDSGEGAKHKEMILEIIHHPNSGEVRNTALRDLKDLGEDTSVFAKRQGFITSWWVIGTFPNEKNEAFGKAFFPEKEVDLEKGGEFEGEKLAWMKVETDEIPAKISLSKAFSKNQFVTAYAYAEINAPDDMPILFLNGTNDGCEFWVNGEKLFETGDERGCEVDGDRVETNLKKGKNQVLLKVLQSGGGWEFCVRLADPDGTPIDLTQVKLLQE